MRFPFLTPTSLRKRHDVARTAMAMCADADGVAREAMECVGTDDDRLVALLERRDEILEQLAEHLVSLKLERPTADGALIASSERAANDADDLVADVCAALDLSHRATIALATRVANRAAELRSELVEVHRAGTAQHAYAKPHSSMIVDSIR